MSGIADSWTGVTLKTHSKELACSIGGYNITVLLGSFKSLCRYLSRKSWRRSFRRTASLEVKGPQGYVGTKHGGKGHN
eukprot:793334-Amphidinium_carterae.1